MNYIIKRIYGLYLRKNLKIYFDCNLNSWMIVVKSIKATSVLGGYDIINEYGVK